MREVVSIGIKHEEVNLFFPKTGSFYLAPFSEIRLMQFTGLKDKRGKEIWEGDILKMKEDICLIDNEEIDVVIFEKGMFKTNCDWDDGCYCIGNGIFLDGDNYLEVVGNIFENPELLKKVVKAE
jgi:uncharacterized phage protein (TIGR01671 family)